jgi:hypothetical protein
MDDVEFRTLKALYDTIKDNRSTSYSAFRRKLKRLAEDNPRTFNAVSRNLGVEPPRRRKHRPGVKHRIVGDFVTYDGEGWDDKLVLLGNSLGERISNPEGLSTVDCLEFMSASYPRRIRRVFFSFGYDVNHIIRDLDDEQIEILLSGLTVTYEGYRISYIPGKIFTVNNYKYYDCFSFFSTSFINVVGRMLGPEAITDSLVEGKKARGEFDTWDLSKLIAYNDEELELLVAILKKLQSAFQEVGVELTEWYGPGAVAKFWFREHGVVPQEKHTSGSIYALNSAYYGGRFEQLSLGRFHNIYEYDIHSAYPSVMADMPYFKSWKSVKEFQDHPYSIWYISFDLRESQKNDDESKNIAFQPLPVRAHDGRICFPLVGKGWYWYPEIRVLLDYFPNAKIVWHKGYLATVEGKPFEWIKELYEYRQEIKATGSISEYAIKVGLNSLYGKCAQRVGNNPYFSLAWAGYITSSTRAKLARAGYEGGSENIIGFATDAVFSTKRLNVPISDNLGDWESSQYDTATFIQSGVYRLTDSDGTNTDRYRGSPLRHGIDDIVEQITRNPGVYPVIKVGRFISHMLAIKAPTAYGPLRLQFVKVEHQLLLDAPYKRHYYDFYAGIDSRGNVRFDYSKLLRQPIRSTPKVWIGDNEGRITHEYLYGNLPIRNFESQPPPVKDRATQLLLEEAAYIAVAEGNYSDVSDLETLATVEDESM